MRINGLMLILIIVAGVFSLLYLWYTILPGRIPQEVGMYFNPEQISQGRRYNQMLRLLYLGCFLFQTAALIWMIKCGHLASLSMWFQRITGGSYWGGMVLSFFILWLCLQLIQLPFTYYGSHYWQQLWGFSTQTAGHWWLDYMKSNILSLLFIIPGLILLIVAVNRWPNTWWFIAAFLVSAWLIIQTLLWPVVVAPLFNRFTPAQDPKLVSMVQELSEKSGVPVSQVLIMDAGSRTTKANAYFTGLGASKRIVLYDTLIAGYPPDQVKSVIAHEMAHWSSGHIRQGLLLGILSNFFFWGMLYILLSTSMTHYTRYPLHLLSVVILFFLLISFISTPIQNYVSRKMEYQADHIAVTLTQDPLTAYQLQIDLASKNLSDVAPAPFIKWFSYSHPTAVERIRNIMSVQ